MDDWGLVQRARRGDDTAFELLVRRHTDAVWRAARAFVRDDHVAEDVTQETFLKAYRSLGSFRGDASVRTWLVAICNRTCIDRSRRRAENVVPLADAARVRAREEPSELRVALEAALATLPDGERQAVVLVDVLGYRSDEAAAIAGVPASTLRSRAGRARRRLLSQLADEEDDGVEGSA